MSKPCEQPGCTQLAHDGYAYCWKHGCAIKESLLVEYRNSWPRFEDGDRDRPAGKPGTRARYSAKHSER